MKICVAIPMNSVKIVQIITVIFYNSKHCVRRLSQESMRLNY